MNQRIKVVSAGSDYINIEEKIAPSLIKEIKVKDYANNLWYIRILYPMKDENTGLSVHKIIYEEEFVGTLDEASAKGEDLIIAHNHIKVEYYEVKHIPHYKKGKFALKLKGADVVEDDDFIEEDVEVDTEESDDIQEAEFVELEDDDEIKQTKKVESKKIKKIKSEKKDLVKKVIKSKPLKEKKQPKKIKKDLVEKVKKKAVSKVKKEVKKKKK